MSFSAFQANFIDSDIYVYGDHILPKNICQMIRKSDIFCMYKHGRLEFVTYFVCVVRLEIVLNMWTILTVHRSTFYMHSMNNTDHLSITKRIEWQKCLTANTLTARYSLSLSLYYLECFVITVCGGTKIRHTNDQTILNHTIPFSFHCVSIYVYKCILRWKSQDRNAQIGTIECSLTPQFWNSNGMKSIKHSTISSSHDLPHLSRFVRRLFVFLAYKMDLVVESILLLVY